MLSRARRALDVALAAGVRVLLRVFFREVEVMGTRPPRGHPLVLVANHENNLLDPLLVLAFSGAHPRFLAKSTLWSHPLVAPLLVLAGALPVYRRQDEGANVAANADTFAASGEVLAAGGAVALFPEGTSHNQPHRLPLKTGAARIVFEAQARHGAKGVLVLPVGLTYDRKDRFRSRVLVQVGPTLDPSQEAASYAVDPRRAVRTLTARIAEALAEVTLNHGSWEEARLVLRAAAFLAEAATPERPPTLSDLWTARKWVWREYQALSALDPQRAADLAGEVSRYDRAAGDMWWRGPAVPGPRLRPAAALLLIPVGLVGLVLNWLPYRLPGRLSGWLTRTPDEPASYKLMAGLVLFPLFWAAEAAAAWSLAGNAGALATLVAAPATGYVALLLSETWEDVREERRRRHLEADPGRELRGLAEQHDRLRRELAEAALTTGRAPLPDFRGPGPYFTKR
jgi:glycerol-3-phosphate O-acyltransferase/dihydroxyacetone phosphate acyltransferase